MNVTDPKKNKNDEDTMAGVYNAWSKLGFFLIWLNVLWH